MRIRHQAWIDDDVDGLRGFTRCKNERTVVHRHIVNASLRRDILVPVGRKFYCRVVNRHDLAIGRCGAEFHFKRHDVVEVCSDTLLHHRFGDRDLRSAFDGGDAGLHQFGGGGLRQNRTPIVTI